MRWLTVLLCAASGILSQEAAYAAEVTDVIDAADGNDPFDFVGTVKYRRSLRRAKITREYNCNGSHKNADKELCGSGEEGRLMLVKELRYQRIVHEIVPEFRFGLWHDLELRIEMPITVSDNRRVRFAGNGGDNSKKPITPDNSTIAPGEINGEDPEDLFAVPQEKSRSGFGDMQFQLRFAPISRERDETRGEWELEFGYRAPTGETMKGNNSGVGRGVHELSFGTAFSYRFSVMDPYFKLVGYIPIPASDTLFKDYGASQDHIGPAPRVDFDLGTEIVAFDRPKQGYKIFIDLGLGAGYQAKGRDYSELFDALASSASGKTQCDPKGVDGDKNCATYNANADSSIKGEHIDGVTTVDEYMTFRGHLGFGALLAHHVQLGFDLSMAHETAHFITSSSNGKDLDHSGLVEYDKPREQNPIYAPAIDAVGRRLRVEETTVFTAGANLSVLF